MASYQIRSQSGDIVAEGSFDTFDEANVWSTEQDVEPGWTLMQQLGGEWTPARHDPTPG